MSDVAITTLESIQDKLPDWYKKFSTDNSVIYAIIYATSLEIANNIVLVDRVNNAIGLNTTDDDDLYTRWGSMLGINKELSMEPSVYRDALKLYLLSKVGGTAESIKYAAAIAIGIDDSEKLLLDYIKVYDAWDYTGDAELQSTAHGNFVCEIDMTIGSSAIGVEQKVLNAISTVKASGTNFEVIYKDAKIITYEDLNRFNFISLDLTTFENLG